MLNKILPFIVTALLSYGAGLVTVSLWPSLQAVLLGPTPTTRLPATSPRQAYPDQPEKKPSVRRSAIFQHGMDENDDAVKPESLFWQAMALVQHPLAGDTLDIDELAMARNAIDHFNADELEVIIRSYTKLAPHDYPEGVDIHDFAKRLGELYYLDLLEGGDTSFDAAEYAGLIDFNSLVQADNMSTEATDNFSSDTKRIYASFDTSNYTKGSVMVKWSRIDSPEVLIFDKYRVDRSMGSNYIWLEPPDGWENGTYQVNIYSLEDNLSPLATGVYGVGE